MFTDMNRLKMSLTMLSEAVKIVASPRQLSEIDPQTLQVFHNSLVQHFETTYTLCWRMLHDYFVENCPSDPVESTDAQRLFQRAMMAGLVDNVADWESYHAARNASVDATSQSDKGELIPMILAFVRSAKKLENSLEQKSRNIGATTIFSRDQDAARHDSLLPPAARSEPTHVHFTLGVDDNAHENAKVA
ncbi:MAG: nucleotidyltransferase substrate binding protein [Thermoguttaceae bacterium]